MNKLTETTVLHILGYTISKPICTVLGTHRFQPLVCFNLTQIIHQYSTECYSPKCYCFSYLMLSAFIKILCSDLAEKKLVWLRENGLQLTCQ